MLVLDCLYVCVCVYERESLCTAHRRTVRANAHRAPVHKSALTLNVYFRQTILAWTPHAHRAWRNLSRESREHSFEIVRYMEMV